MELNLQHILYQIENTFRKDDVHSAPREVLENLIVSVYDQLRELNYSDMQA